MARPTLSLASVSGRARVGLLIFVVIILLHSTLTITNETYAETTSLKTITAALPVIPGLLGDTTHPEVDEVLAGYYVDEEPDPWLTSEPRANATLVMLARNKDVQGALNSVRKLEDRFNRRRRYPWVFLNDEPFNEEFKRRVRLQTRSDVQFGLIDREQWVQPSWIDESKAKAGRKKLSEVPFVPYAESVPYRNMCRYNSGFFFRHKLLEPYKWYWRVEPDVDFTCDIQFDPFLYMQDHNKTYGFTVSLIEFGATIPTLWQATKDFIKQNPKYVAHENALPFITEDDGESYNNCHFWSNFEISDLDFWRSPAYLAYFDHLDRAGGFYYERWGDAPVHSLAAALFLPKQQLHFFAPIGYEHAPHNHCPLKSDGYNDNHCQCGPEHTFDERPDSCLTRYKERVGVTPMGRGW